VLDLWDIGCLEWGGVLFLLCRELYNYVDKAEGIHCCWKVALYLFGGVGIW
jgi:hypothetical protein